MTYRPYKRPIGYAFDGEPRVVLDAGGADIEINGGQPVMDAGVENAALISLLTDPGWFGNTFLEAEYRVGDSTLTEVLGGALTKTTFSRAEGEAKRALQWMLDEGIASEIRASFANRAGTGVDADVTIVRPNGDERAVSLRRYGPNWIRQGTDPASARLRGDYEVER